MQDAVREVVEECGQRSVDVGMLAALMAIRSCQRPSAVEAAALMRMPVALAGLRLDRAAQDSAGDRVCNRFEFPHIAPLGGKETAC
jgi:hypothetical protein